MLETDAVGDVGGQFLDDLHVDFDRRWIMVGNYPDGAHIADGHALQCDRRTDTNASGIVEIRPDDNFGRE